MDWNFQYANSKKYDRRKRVKINSVIWGYIKFYKCTLNMVNMTKIQNTNIMSRSTEDLYILICRKSANWPSFVYGRQKRFLANLGKFYMKTTSKITFYTLDVRKQSTTKENIIPKNTQDHGKGQQVCIGPVVVVVDVWLFCTNCRVTRQGVAQLKF